MENQEVVKYDPSTSLKLQTVADGLFKSGLFPNAKNSYGAFSIVQYGHELGIPPMMSLKNINIISGQLACNAQLMLFLATQKGVTYKVLEEGNKGAKIAFKRGANEYTAEFNETDARDAGLLGKDNWKKYPKDMYFWRAVAKGVRRVCPDAVMGLYTADEISSGEYIDVKEVVPEPPKEDAAPFQEEQKPKSVSDLQETTITVKDVEEQTKKPDGTPLDKPIYHILSDDGDDYRTFDKSLATIASKEAGTNLMMVAEYKKTRFGLDIKSLYVAE